MSLYIPIRKYLIRLDAEHLAHGLIGVDGVTLDGILELVALDVGAKGLGDIRGGHLRPGRLTEESAERITKRNRCREDSRALGNGRSALHRRRPIAATTTTSLLKILRHTLLKTAERLETHNRRITDGLKLGHQGIDVLGNGRGWLDIRGRGRYGAGLGRR
jgi:hypothetical protein